MNQNLLKTIDKLNKEQKQKHGEELKKTMKIIDQITKPTEQQEARYLMNAVVLLLLSISFLSVYISIWISVLALTDKFLLTGITTLILTFIFSKLIP